jgi:hypothetical protein
MDTVKLVQEATARESRDLQAAGGRLFGRPSTPSSLRSSDTSEAVQEIEQQRLFLKMSVEDKSAPSSRRP